MLGFRTQDHSIVRANESAELWWPLIGNYRYGLGLMRDFFCEACDSDDQNHREDQE